MQDHYRTPSATASSSSADPLALAEPPLSVDMSIPPLGIEVEELKDRQQRTLDALRAHIDTMFAENWELASRSPLTLRRGKQMCHVLHGMLISDRFI